MKSLLLVCALAVSLTGCATQGTVGDYAMGDDSAAIKGARNREVAQISQAELAQHRRQRADVSEELELEAQKRRNKQDEIRGNMGTAAGAIGLVGGAAALIRAFR